MVHVNSVHTYPIFSFLFAHETKSWTREQANTGIRGTLTDEHVPYILGYPLSAGRDKEGQIYGGFNNDDKVMSKVMMQYVANFVKSGSVFGEGLFYACHRYTLFRDPSKPQPISSRTVIEERFHGTMWPQFSQATREAFLEISRKLFNVLGNG